MPYSKEHKEQSRQRILQSARELFSSKGFNSVTVDEVMANCAMTRGAFYAHFSSKAELYKEALKFSAANSDLARQKPENISAKEWLSQLLDGYLSVEHVKGLRPCPLAFLATDIASQHETTKEVYAQTYKNMNRLILHYAGINENRSEKDVLSLTSMIIGAVAISRTIEDLSLVEDILSSCRKQVNVMLSGI